MSFTDWLGLAATLPPAAYALTFLAYRRAWQRLGEPAARSGGDEAAGAVAPIVASSNQGSAAAFDRSDSPDGPDSPDSPGLKPWAIEKRHPQEAIAADAKAESGHRSVSEGTLSIAQGFNPGPGSRAGRGDEPGMTMASTSAEPLVSVIIAARDEAATLPNLLADLRRQTAPGTPTFEVIVADDHSTDATAALVMAAATDTPFYLRLLKLAELPGQPTGKKAAVEAALHAARAPWVVCTDADCRVPAGWLAAYARVLAEPGVQFVSGPVLLTGPGLMAALQGLELAGLVGSGAAAIALGAPTMCNGANLAYRRAAFAEVGGYAGNAHLPSGDDEFLLHKIAARYPGGIRFLRRPEATVRTAAQPTLPALLRQRVRWASKWRHYQSPTSRRLALLVLGANLALYLLLALALGQPAARPWAAAGWALKLGADVAFLSPVLGFFGRRRWLLLVPLLQLGYPPYALVVGLLGLRGGYRWKGRQVA